MVKWVECSLYINFFLSSDIEMLKMCWSVKTPSAIHSWEICLKLNIDVSIVKPGPASALEPHKGRDGKGIGIALSNLRHGSLKCEGTWSYLWSAWVVFRHVLEEGLGLNFRNSLIIIGGEEDGLGAVQMFLHHNP